MAQLNLVARLGLDKSGFDAGMSAATRQTTKFGSHLKAQLAGAFSVAAIAAFARSALQAAGRIKDLSEQFGITTDEVQQLDHALKQSGMSFEDAGSALMKLGAGRKDAVEGNLKLREAFNALGVSLEDLNNPAKTNYDLLRQIAVALSQTNVGAAEQAEIMEILGTKAGKLANVLANLNETEPLMMFPKETLDNLDAAGKQLDVILDTLKALMAVAISEEWNKAKALGEFLGNLAQGDFSDLDNFIPKGGDIAKGLNARVGKIGVAGGAAAGGDKVAGGGSGLAGLLKAAWEGAMGAVAKAPGQLWKVDANKKVDGAEGAGRAFANPLNALPGGDSLGRIGAFSGGGTSRMETEIKGMNRHLDRIEKALTTNGIRVKDL